MKQNQEEDLRYVWLGLGRIMLIDPDNERVATIEHSTGEKFVAVTIHSPSGAKQMEFILDRKTGGVTRETAFDLTDYESLRDRRDEILPRLHELALSDAEDRPLPDYALMPKATLDKYREKYGW